MSRSRTLAAATILAVIAAACGAATGGPVAVPSEDLPFDPRRQVEQTDPAAPTELRRVAFVRRGKLIELTRRIAADVPPEEGLLRALLEGPTPQEGQRGIGSAVPSATKLLNVVVLGDVAEIDLSEEFQQAGSSETLALRVAQVVWTITELPGIIAVTFLIDGEHVTPVNGRGESVDRPVTRADYADLVS